MMAGLVELNNLRKRYKEKDRQLTFWYLYNKTPPCPKLLFFVRGKKEKTEQKIFKELNKIR